MSLAKIKAKEGGKCKQKFVPKLKTILVNPIKTRCPTLHESDMNHLYNIIKPSIDRSEETPSQFATNKRICIGLESSLRCLNNAKSSCVFISLSIKPIHIVSLIARNAEVKDSKQPVFAQPNLEDFTEKLFGIRAMCLVLPKELQGISEDLCKWVEQRQKPKTVSLKEQNVLKRHTNKKKKKLANSMQKEKDIQNDEAKETDAGSTNETKSWSGDFISFGETKGDSQLCDDKNDALNALTQMMSNMPKLPVTVIKKDSLTSMEIDNVVDEVDESKEKDEDSEDSMDFLGTYKELIVHKIRPNPNKKPKKKRNKNKNKNLKK